MTETCIYTAAIQIVAVYPFQCNITSKRVHKTVFGGKIFCSQNLLYIFAFRIFWNISKGVAENLHIAKSKLLNLNPTA